LYKTEGLDIEPNWKLIFIAFARNEDHAITEISEKLQFSIAVVKIFNKMKKRHVEQEDYGIKEKQIYFTEKL